MSLFKVKRNVTIPRDFEADKDAAGNSLKGKPLAILTDEADGNVHIDCIGRDGKSAHWVRMSKRNLFLALTSLWPDEVAIVSDILEEDNEDD